MKRLERASDADDHAILSPSGATIWMECLPSVQFEQVEKEPHPNTIRGNIGHALLEYSLVNGVDVDTKDFDLRQDVEICLAHVETILDSYDDPLLFCEIKLPYNKFLFGTSDVCILVEGHNTGVLHIMDAKFGDMPVSVGTPENPNRQLAIYGRLALEKFEAERNIIINTVHLHIMQPKRSYFEYVSIERAELLHYTAGVLMVANNLDRADLTTGYNPGSHCRFCPGVGKCAAQKEYVKSALTVLPAKITQNKVLDKVKEISIDQCVEIHEKAPLIKKLLEGVENRLLAEAMNENLPGYKVVRGRANRKWAKPTDETVEALEKMGVNPFEEKLRGIPSIEKEIGEQINPLVVKPEGKLTLVVESDKRESVSQRKSLLSTLTKLE